MISVSSIVSSLLQSLEFFRSGWGRWVSLFFSNPVVSSLFLLPLLIWGLIRFFIGLFTQMCSAISSLLNQMGFHGVVVGGVDVLALANSVLPLDELMALIIMWFTIYGLCASIRFIRAAWQAIPFKAT